MKGLYSLFLILIIAVVFFYTDSMKNVGKIMSETSSKPSKEKTIQVKEQPPVSETSQKKEDIPTDFPLFVNKSLFIQSKEGNSLILTLQVKPADSSRIDNYVNYTLPAAGWMPLNNNQLTSATRIQTYLKKEKRVMVQVVFDSTRQIYTGLRYTFFN